MNVKAVNLSDVYVVGVNVNIEVDLDPSVCGKWAPGGNNNGGG
jgi:hypothetical protein